MSESSRPETLRELLSYYDPFTGDGDWSKLRVLEEMADRIDRLEAFIYRPAVERVNIPGKPS